MDKPTILFIAPSCYPIDGAEANVNAKVIKTLTESGCTVDLISRKSTKSLCYPKSVDNYYFSKIRKIVEVDWYIKKDIRRFWNHLKVYFKTGNTYIWADWAYPAIKVCEDLIAQNHYDYIYTFNSPSEIIGLYLTKKYGIKWVATWNDPYCWKKYPAPYGGGPASRVSALRQRLINEIGSRVYRNIFPSERLKNYMMKYMIGLTDETCVICPHLVLDSRNEIQTLDNSTLRIIHAGALGRERDPKTFLIRLNKFIKKYPDANIRITILGVFERSNGADIKEYIEQNDLNQYIEFLPPVSYRDSLDIIAQYNVCLLIEAPCDEGIFLPSKVADYMQLNKPILSISPSVGTLNDLYKAMQIAYFADVRDENAIAEELEKIYSNFSKGKISNLPGIDKFTPDEYIRTQKDYIWK